MSYYLIGHPLEHSFSPRLHALLGNPDYRLMDLDASGLKDFLHKKEFDGINVTIPYKQTVIPFCDEVSEKALGIGAVNTIIRRGDGSLFGDNTDITGLMSMADHAGISLENKVVLILGSGGTSHTAWYAAQAAGARKVYRVSRGGPVNYENVYLCILLQKEFGFEHVLCAKSRIIKRNTIQRNRNIPPRRSS